MRVTLLTLSMSKSRRIKICKVKACPNPATTMGHCRMHYLKNWQTIKAAQKKKAVKNLNNYIEHIMKKNPDGYVTALKEDLQNQEQFSRKVDTYFYDNDFMDLMDDIESGDVNRIIGSLKVDDAY
jgi:hypothetical protein